MANLNVPAEGWEKLDAPQQEQIRGILRSNNLLKEGDDITPDSSLKMADSSPKMAGDTEANSVCTTACDVAEQAAKVACNALPWPASTVCTYAAEKAGDFCRSQC